MESLRRNRRRRGTCSPAAETWAGACERSEALVHAARLDIDSSVGEFWDTHTDRALAPYLLAAAASNKPPSAIYAWIASQRVDEPQRILADAQLPEEEREAALLDLRTASILSPDHRSNLAVSLIRVLSALRLPDLARNLAGGFTPERLADREHPATLYITIPADEQRRARAFVIALVEAAYLAAYRAGSIQPVRPAAAVADRRGGAHRSAPRSAPDGPGRARRRHPHRDQLAGRLADPAPLRPRASQHAHQRQPDAHHPSRLHRPRHARARTRQHRRARPERRGARATRAARPTAT